MASYSFSAIIIFRILNSNCRQKNPKKNPSLDNWWEMESTQQVIIVEKWHVGLRLSKNYSQTKDELKIVERAAWSTNV